jgi:dTDP-4-dehydrorhamnose reductase
MRYLILGAGGQLATELERELMERGQPVLALTHAQADICDTARVACAVRDFEPDFLVNTAAYHRVDECEDQVAKSFQVNAVALQGLARVANEAGAVLVHFSTDYVFDGNKREPYCETDPPRPLSVYGISKLAGEWIVQRYAERYFLIRTCGLYGGKGSPSKGGNFVETMIRLAAQSRPIRVVNDQIATPTYARHLARALVPLLESRRYGLYHMTASGACSWYEFAQEIFLLTGLQADLQPVSSTEFAARARRPAYSVLDNCALRAAGFPDLPPWQQGLAEYLRNR